MDLAISLVLAMFAILFGARHSDATEHQRGLMLAIAVESVVKIAAFLAVGAFVVFGMFGGIEKPPSEGVGAALRSHGYSVPASMGERC